MANDAPSVFCIQKGVPGQVQQFEGPLPEGVGAEVRQTGGGGGVPTAWGRSQPNGEGRMYAKESESNIMIHISSLF